MSRSSFLAVLLTFLLLVSLLAPVMAAPTGPTITYNKTETVTPAAAASLATVGGSFTTLVLNATTQTPRWKAYVGNVTGTFTLRDAQNSTIYDWQGSYTAGEVYAARKSVSWSTIGCVQNASVTAEDAALNISEASVDSINRTFNKKVHRSFYVGTTPFTNSSCRAIATYLNSTSQSSSESAKFQEVLLQDTNQTLVFTALLDPDTLGFNNQPYDFQMIVPEDEYATVPHTYYFWVELS